MTTFTSAPLTYTDLPALLERQHGEAKHERAAASTLDVLWVLYDRILHVDPRRPDDPGRDRFLLSKGHGPNAYYAVLAAKGFIPAEWLDSVARFASPLGSHPDRMLVPGVEISSGSLGHGLPLAVGMALGLAARQVRRPDGTAPRVVVLVGDGELDEGSNHEAIAYAGAVGLAGLTVVAVDNGSARYRWRGGIGRWFEVAGWSAVTVDGRDHDALEAALRAGHPGAPLAVVAEVTR